MNLYLVRNKNFIGESQLVSSQLLPGLRVGSDRLSPIEPMWSFKDYI